ncbi:S-adenosyl-L-methionine-dependent methyltransferase [Gorgonomyces haynaldii]|nr:S-adenosyl-L-methionine-dependent methyltransferase [Gorgonomyces haynaldii]
MASILPEKNKEYGKLNYWNDRYDRETVENVRFDWFKDWESLRNSMLELMPQKQALILHLGCGNSTLGPDLYKDGWQSIVNVDYAENVIEHMKTEYALMTEMRWETCDIFQLDKHYQPETFDCAIDKGTLDALLTREHDPWDPEPEILQDIQAYIHQVYKSLKVNGTFLHITFAQPHFRRRFLEIDGFQVETHVLKSKDGGFDYFCYLATKK